MSRLLERRFDKVWQLRNAGRTHAAIGRELGITTQRVREIIRQSMHDRDAATFGEADSPERYWHLERFGPC